MLPLGITLLIPWALDGLIHWCDPAVCVSIPFLFLRLWSSTFGTVFFFFLPNG